MGGDHPDTTVPVDWAQNTNLLTYLWAGEGGGEGAKGVRAHACFFLLLTYVLIIFVMQLITFGVRT